MFVFKGLRGGVGSPDNLLGMLEKILCSMINGLGWEVQVMDEGAGALWGSWGKVAQVGRWFNTKPFWAGRFNVKPF